MATRAQACAHLIAEERDWMATVRALRQILVDISSIRTTQIAVMINGFQMCVSQDPFRQVLSEFRITCTIIDELLPGCRVAGGRSGMVILFNQERETVIESPTLSPLFEGNDHDAGRHRPTPSRPSRSKHAILVTTTTALVYEHYFNHHGQSRPFHDTFRGLWQAQGLRR